MERVLLACASAPLLLVAALLAVLAAGSAPLFRQTPPTEFLAGLLPLLGNTLLVVMVALLVAVPAGLLAAIGLSEYAAPRIRRPARAGLDLLAGVPTVVWGAAALLLLTPLLQRWLPALPEINALGAGIVVGIMILPMVSALSEEALQRVPRGLRDAAAALGATRLQATLRVVLPAARAGIAAAVVLAAARAAGETMIVALASVETLTAAVLQIGLGNVAAGSPAWHTIFAVGLLLFAGTFGLNLLGAWLRLRRQEGGA